MNRNLEGIFGTEDYAKEELRAELASVFMQTELGITIDGHHFENHGAYLSSWLNAVRKDAKEFFAAARDAENISDYVAEHYLQSERKEEKAQEKNQFKENNEIPVFERNMPFADQVDKVLSGADTENTHLEVLPTTPQILQDVGLPNLPILMTAKHLKSITQESGSDRMNYHALGAEMAKHLPELLSDPVMIMDSLTREDSIVTVIESLDKENRPVIGAIKVNGLGYSNEIEISANILTSVYGKDNFQSFLERNIEAGNILYYNKEKSQVLFEIPGIQFPNNLNSLDSDIIIRKARAFVKTSAEKNQENSAKGAEERIITGEHKEKNPEKYQELEKIKNQMLDSWGNALRYYSIQNESYFETDEFDQEIEKEGKGIYVIADNGFVHQDQIMPKNSYFHFSDLPYGNRFEHIEVSMSELEERAQEYRQSIEAYAAVLKEVELSEGKSQRSSAYYMRKAKDVIDEFITSDFDMAAEESSIEQTAAQENGKHRKEYEKDVETLENTKNGAQKPNIEAGEPKQRKWINLDIPSELLGAEGESKSRMIKLPQGEYSHFVLFVPKAWLKPGAQAGSMKLSVEANSEYVIRNDGREVRLSGSELRAVFEGKEVGKRAQRVAPSRRTVQAMDALDSNVPDEMKALPNWCVFRTTWNEEKGKKDKSIISPVDGKWGKSNDPSTWTDFETAKKYALEHGAEGLAFALDESSGICCIDLDKCIDKDGNLTDSAKKLTSEHEGTYIETSTSGNGIHIFVKDDLLAKGKFRNRVEVSDGEIEVYESGRFISMTGNVRTNVRTLGQTPQTTKAWLRRTLGERAPQQSYVPTGKVEGSDEEIIERIRKSAKGPDFEALMAGENLCNDHSRSDYRLLNMLAFFTDSNQEQMARIFRSSGLYRPDKGEPYLQRSITAACSGLKTRYGQGQGGAFRSSSKGPSNSKSR